MRGTRGAVALLVGALALTACSSAQEKAPPPTAEVQARPSAPASERVRPLKPNIVLVLMDDVSMDLLQTMRHAAEMGQRGATYSQAYVVDSLCCVSRASLATGQFPHQTGVLTNTANTPNAVGPIGGWEAFSAYGNPRRSVNVALRRSGYATGFVGKYLNQYEPYGGVAPELPPGWTEWNAIFGSAYDGWGFESTYVEDGALRLRSHDAPPSSAGDAEKDAAYVGTVTEELALDFIRTHQPGAKPYFLQVSPYAAHGRVNATGHYADDPSYPPAMADRPRPGQPDGNCGLVDCADLGIDDLPAFDDDPADNAPAWADGSPAPTWRPDVAPPARRVAVRSLRDRARMVQSVDRMLGRLLEAVDDDTYVILTSDNGYHLGQHRMGQGKGLAYDSDVHVPLVLVGPGVVPGERTGLVTNLDLAPTFEELAGLAPAAYRSGRSIVPTLVDPGLDEREAVVFEHTWAPSLGADPDKAYSGGTMDDIPSYVAARGDAGLLVRLDLDHSWEGTRHAWEFYSYDDVPWERTNEYADPAHRDDIAALRAVIEAHDACREFTRGDAVPERCR